MKYFILFLIATISINLSAHRDGLEYGEYKKYFQLGEVEFYRSAGKLDGKTSDFDVIAKNNYPFEVCLVPTFDLIRNAREDYYEPNYILGPNSEVELGHYGAIVFGRSWQAKWDFFISTNLENCVI